MIKSLKYILIFAILVAEFSASSGQSQNDPNDSLYYYLELASKNNPLVLQSFQNIRQHCKKYPSSSLSDPELSIGVFLKPMELIGGNQIADIRLMQMFPWFGTLKSCKR